MEMSAFTMQTGETPLVEIFIRPTDLTAVSTHRRQMQKKSMKMYLLVHR